MGSPQGQLCQLLMQTKLISESVHVLPSPCPIASTWPDCPGWVQAGMAGTGMLVRCLQLWYQLVKPDIRHISKNATGQGVN